MSKIIAAMDLAGWLRAGGEVLRRGLEALVDRLTKRPVPVPVPAELSERERRRDP